MENIEYLGEKVFQLIPQRAPIVMIDGFKGFRDDVSLTSLNISEDNIFVHNGCFIESGVIEHVAQSAAARVGYLAHQNKKEIPLGFIGSVDKFEFVELPTVGDVLNTEISIVQEIFDITLIHAKVFNRDKMIASGNMKIFVQKNEKE